MLGHIILLSAALLIQAPPQALVIFHAGSLSVPLDTVGKEFRKNNPSVEIQAESAGSVESARKISDLHQEADIVAVADYKVIENILFPAYADWSVIFARNHMVIAYTERSKFSGDITPDNWYKVLLRKGVEYGHSDPEKDPCGYRTLMVWQLAERFYKEPGLFDRLQGGCPPRNIRPKEVDIIALQEAGDIDYHFQYRSVAQQHGLKYVDLPPQIDLGSWQDKNLYSTAKVELRGKKPGETITMTGEPILYALTIPKTAPHPELAERFISFLLGPEGRRILGQLGQDPVHPPVVVNPGNLPKKLKKFSR